MAGEEGSQEGGGGSFEGSETPNLGTWITSEPLRCPHPWPAPSDRSAIGAHDQGEKSLASAPSPDVYEWGGEGITPTLGKTGYHGNHSAPPLTSTVLTRWRQLPHTIPGLLTLSLPADRTPGQHRRAPASLPKTHLLLQVCFPAPLWWKGVGERKSGEAEAWNPQGIR